MATSIFTSVMSNTAQSLKMPNALPSVTIGSGKKRLVQVPSTYQGRLTDVEVFQTDAGTPVAFTVDVLKSSLPFPINQDVPVAQPPAINIEFVNIVNTISATAGTHAQLQEQNIGYAFRNLDGTVTNTQRYVYLLITPTGAVAPTTWDISVTVESTVGL